MARTEVTKPRAGRVQPDFTFLTNHSHVLVCLASTPGITLREVANRVGITERAVIAIVRDLQAARVLSISKEGRRNIYRIHAGIHLRHAVEAHRTVGDLLRAILGEP
ncbi:MAG TPA: winged helix-turn-helix transcriptional regulator [Turneriella sp.]|nr:winged helix-turn-helix transcriptional regulator [Turneriella sp.]